MSFFDDNSLGSVGDIHIEAAEGYSGAIGAQLALIEGYHNDYAMFEAAIKADIKETKMVREGAGEEAVSALQEASLSGFWNKIKEFIKKIIAKIKAIFHGFIAKFQAWMGKDGRAFFEKYKRDIFGKDVDGLKVRYSAPKVDVTNISVNVGNIIRDGGLDDEEHSELVEKYLGQLTSPSVKASGKEFRTSSEAGKQLSRSLRRPEKYPDSDIKILLIFQY
jgi:hypothetical protein